MRIIWRTKQIELPLGANVVGLKHKSQRPHRIILSEEEEEALEKLDDQGKAYKRKLKKALCFGGELC